jgi:hypothetical protein
LDKLMTINGLTVLWFMIATGLLSWAVSLWHKEIYNQGYWRGRAIGWESHRRLINIQKQSDEVFDYEKN